MRAGSAKRSSLQVLLHESLRSRGDSDTCCQGCERHASQCECEPVSGCGCVAAALITKTRKSATATLAVSWCKSPRFPEHQDQAEGQVC